MSTRPACRPPAIPLLPLRYLVGSAGHIQQGVNDLLVVPAGRELGLAPLASPVTVPAATLPVSVEYVRGAIGSDPERIQLRAILGSYRVPAGTVRFPAAIGGPNHLVILQPRPRFRRSRGRVGIRSAPVPGALERRVARSVVVRPV